MHHHRSPSAQRNFAGARAPVPYLVEMRVPLGESVAKVLFLFFFFSCAPLTHTCVAGGGSEALCGGSIIDETHVLSAAHCVVDEGVQVATTVIISVTNNRNGRPIWTGRGRAVVHPSYRDNTEADVVVVTLSERIPLGGDIQAVPLAPENPAVGTWGLLAGYGTTLHSQDNDSPLIKTVENSVSRCSPANARKICVRGVDRAQRRGNSCVGDSGGPLVIDGMLVGVLSRGSPDCGRDSVDIGEFCSVAGNLVSFSSECFYIAVLTSFFLWQGLDSLHDSWRLECTRSSRRQPAFVCFSAHQHCAHAFRSFVVCADVRSPERRLARICRAALWHLARRPCSRQQRQALPGWR